MKKSFFTLLTIVALTTGAAAQELDDPRINPVPEGIRIIDDIAYRSGDSDSWKLDLATPENIEDGERLPAIVIVHGGGWRVGSRKEWVYRNLLMDYAAKGYVTISVGYRFTSEAPFPACIEDVKCAIRWLRAHADEYHVDPERIGAYGHSAGAHLVLMAAMSGSNKELEGDGGWDGFSSGLTSVIGGSSPTHSRGRGLSDPAWVPLTYISEDAPPMLIIHGAEDETVPVENADEFVKLLREKGAKDVTYLRVEGGLHATAYNLHLDVTQPAMDEFFERTLKK